MKIRLATVNAPSFRELGEGNELSPSWREIDLSKLDARAKDVFELHVGRIIQVHPDDVSKVKTFEGLELHENTFRYPGGDAKDKPPIGERHQLAAGEHTASNPERAPAPALRVTVATDEETARAVDTAKTRRTAGVSPGATATGTAPRGADVSKPIDETHADPANTGGKKR